jgi:hypothetical protein
MKLFMVDHNTKKIERLNCDLDTQIHLGYVSFYKLRDTIYSYSRNVIQPEFLIKQSVYRKYK